MNYAINYALPQERKAERLALISVLLSVMKMGLPRAYRRYGEALVLSITLVPGKAYTAAVTQCKTKDVAAAAAEGASLMAIQTNDPRITLVAGGYPLIWPMEKLQAVIAVGGGTEAQDCEIAEYVVSVFDEEVNRV